MPKKFYVIFEGHQPGIYNSWPECSKYTKDFIKPVFRGYETEDEAKKAYKEYFMKNMK